MTDTKNIDMRQNITLLDSLLQIDIDSDNLFDEVFEHLQKYLNFDAGTIYLLNAKSKILHKVDSYSQDVEILTGLQIESGDGLTGWSADTAQALIIADRTKKKSYDPDSDFASFMSVPILKADKLYGVINLASFTSNVFTKGHINIIETIAPTLSLLMKHYQLLKKFKSVEASYKKSVAELQNLTNQVVSDSTIDEISHETSEVIHGINNSLSIIIGNLQCLVVGKNDFNQKTISRLKKIETAAKRIAEANTQILKLYSLVNKQAEKTSYSNKLVKI